MIISATGIVFDHYGDVLLIQRNDTRTLAPPGGAAEINELPPDTAVREVKEETGLIVMPVRLVGLYYLPTKPNDYLSFCYRCILRGGELAGSEESPRLGFFKTNPYPKPMLPLSQERVQRSLEHRGGPPYLGTHQLSRVMKTGNMILNTIIYPWFNLRRKFTGKEQHIPPPKWQIKPSIILRDDQQRVLWVKDPNNSTWTLPGGTSPRREPPWKTINRILTSTWDLSIDGMEIKGIYMVKDKPEMQIVFDGKLPSPDKVLANKNAGVFLPGEEPESINIQHQKFVKDRDDTKISYQLLGE